MMRRVGLLAGPALLVVTLCLARNWAALYDMLIPAVVMLFLTSWAMVLNLATFFSRNDRLLLAIGCAALLLELRMVIEGLVILMQVNGKRLTAVAEPAE